MNIAIMTTWNSYCGISEYSRHLVDELLNMKEKHNILLFTNKEDTLFTTHPRRMTVSIFGVTWWGEDSKINLDKMNKASIEFQDKFGAIDVLNIQYQSSLYEVKGFNEVIKRTNSKLVITQHDSTRNPKHNFPNDVPVIVHNKDLRGTFIPFPTVERNPWVFSFGMGRNDYDFIEAACAEIGAGFDCHDGREDVWWSEDELFKHMELSDAIVLWYNEVPLKGQSAALRTAISSHRPVIVNNVGWFKDAPPFVRKVSTKDELQIAIAEATHLEYIRKNSYTNCAKEYIKIFKENK